MPSLSHSKWAHLVLFCFSKEHPTHIYKFGACWCNEDLVSYMKTCSKEIETPLFLVVFDLICIV